MNAMQIDYLVAQLSHLTDAAVQETSLAGFDLRRLLRFLSRVVQVAEQAFQDVLALMIEFKYASEADVQTGGLKQLAKELDLLQARSRYRDAEEICSRLHHLTDYYEAEIEPITNKLPNRDEWWSIYRMLNEHEGLIIALVHESIFEIEHLLPRSNIETINRAAEIRVDYIRDSLTRLRDLNSQILGLSGTAGLLELSEAEDSRGKVNLEVKVRDIYTVSGQAGAVGPGAQAKEMTFVQLGQQVAQSVDLDELANELAQLRKAMKNESITVEQDIAISEVAKAEQAAKANDPTTLAEHLRAAGKWALDIAAQIGVPLAIAALKQVVGIK